jgi:ATP-dependent metalloprotease FtsH
MRKVREYAKEITFGMSAAGFAFMLYLGVPALPLVFGAIVAAGLYMISRQRGWPADWSWRKPPARQPAYLSFDDIGGQEQAKRELLEALDFLVYRDKISKMGIRPLKGILLTGPPGTGKTLLAKAAAHYTDSAFVAASGSEFVEMYVGVGAGRIRELFRNARRQALKAKQKSAIVFIDEIDVIGGKRDGGQHREYDQTLNQLLTEMDGIQGDEEPRVLIIAATNRPELLDPALLRPGRFDRQIRVDLPDKKGREHILRLHARNKPLARDVSLSRVADETFGFSGAQLESVMNEAAIYAMREGKEEISREHLSLAIDKVMMGERTDRQATKEERERVAIHELGHAIVAETLRPGSVAQVSLTPRGQALGYVRHHPDHDRYLYTKPFLEEQIMIALGGAAAEEIYFGARSTGSRSDFEHAANIARTMIESGMSGLGIVHPEALTKEELSRESAAILNVLAEQTRRLLEERRPAFDRVLKWLIREETLSGKRLRQLLKVDTPPEAANCRPAESGRGTPVTTAEV